MRAMIIVAVVGLGIVGIAFAQQPGAQSKPLVGDKSALRAQVVSLRAEIEVLQLEHDADREILLAWMKAERTGTGGLAGMAIELNLASMGGAEADKAIEEGEKLIAKAKEKGEDVEAVGRRVLSEAVKKQIGALKINYTKQAKELAEKRLQLDALEKQYLKVE
jgi:hypothetical protein